MPPHLTTPIYDPDGSSGSSLVVKDEGVVIPSPTALDFVGAGVTATDTGAGVVQVTIPGGSGGGSGDVVGPSSAVDFSIARFGDITGKLLKGGANTPTISDAGNVTPVALATFDGRDISVDGAALDAHVAASAPHTGHELVSQKGSANGYAALDSGGKVPTTQLPALAITTPFPVASQAAMLALTAEEGDVAIRSDILKSFILKTAGDPTQLADWLELRTPTDSVSSVAGKTGVVTLDHATDLANVGTNSHATLDTFLASKAAASGLASLDSGTKVPIAQIPTGTTGSTVPLGNDSRFGDARTPSGAAGGDLGGTYPNPTIGAGKVIGAALAASAISTVLESKLTSGYVLVSETLSLGTTVPISISDATFSGRVAGGSVIANGVIGVVAPSFSAATNETGTGSGKAGLGSNDPLGDAAYAGQKGISVQLRKANGGEFELIDMISAAIIDVNAKVYGYLSYRSDLGANLKWRLWLYYRRTADGVEVAITPTMTNPNAKVWEPEVFYLDGLPVAAGLGTGIVAGEAAAALGPGSVGTTELAALAVTTAKIADANVTAAKASIGTVFDSTKLVASNDGRLARHIDCRFATIGNDSLSGLAARDGVTPVAGDVAFVNQQTTTTANGFYVAASGAWSRIPEVLTPGMTATVMEGDTMRRSMWMLGVDAPIVVGTSVIGFVDISVQTQAAIAQPMFMTGVQAAAVMIATYNGGMFRTYQRIRVTHLQFRCTTTSGVGTFSIGIYQVPGGHAAGTAKLLASVVAVAGVVGNYDQVIVEGTAIIEPGTYYALVGKASGTAFSLRVWTQAAIDLLSTNVVSGQVPTGFTTAIASTSAPPATVVPLTDFAADGGSWLPVLRLRSGA